MYNIEQYFQERNLRKQDRFLYNYHTIGFNQAKKKILLYHLGLYSYLHFCELNSVKKLVLTKASAKTVSGGTVSSVWGRADYPGLPANCVEVVRTTSFPSPNIPHLIQLSVWHSG